MKSKRKFLISTLAVVLTAALAVGVFFLTKAVTRPMSAEEYMPVSYTHLTLPTT